MKINVYYSFKNTTVLCTLPNIEDCCFHLHQLYSLFLTAAAPHLRESCDGKDWAAAIQAGTVAMKRYVLRSFHYLQMSTALI